MQRIIIALNQEHSICCYSILLMDQATLAQLNPSLSLIMVSPQIRLLSLYCRLKKPPVLSFLHLLLSFSFPLKTNLCSVCREDDPKANLLFFD
ncbi:hypothetical protein TRFO_36223 [Tritrichomonas foetus]|uniref:Uncharacterized protein n=1 Tax=Tritrichomonas foetus TaxID=1144522 RepID=A0A1J4JEF3_9EUKA|nr:hypothetical protein TRFO_36223 [Tritrichomonas foetus]|eukprot:OHS97538.1 hypothetical protein TRFO_36223 [Tritrichomonas foetus]